MMESLARIRDCAADGNREKGMSYIVEVGCARVR